MVSSSVKVIKWLIFVFNFLFFLTGCGLIAVGVWLNVDRDDWEGISDYDYISVANLIIAAGAIIIIIAFLGCCGAITENKIMLLLFFIFLLIIFILELGAGIAAYIWRGEINDELKDQLIKRIPDRYYTEDGVKKAMNTIQNEFDCCGVDGIADWKYLTRAQTGASNGKVDPSCCRKTGEKGYSATCVGVERPYDVTFELNDTQYYNQGCYTSIKDFLEDNLLYVGICGIVFAVFQILGMVFAMVLYCAIRKEALTV